MQRSQHLYSINTQTGHASQLMMREVFPSSWINHRVPQTMSAPFPLSQFQKFLPLPFLLPGSCVEGGSRSPYHYSQDRQRPPANSPAQTHQLQELRHFLFLLYCCQGAPEVPLDTMQGIIKCCHLSELNRNCYQQFLLCSLLFFFICFTPHLSPKPRYCLGLVWHSQESNKTTCIQPCLLCRRWSNTEAAVHVGSLVRTCWERQG